MKTTTAIDKKKEIALRLPLIVAAINNIYFSFIGGFQVMVTISTADTNSILLYKR